jgi:hypothetical protein
MQTNQEYQKKELAAFLNQKNKYFDTVKEFSENLEQMNLSEQIEWIEYGSYGAGACFALQHTLNRITPRMNADAHIGQTILHTFYGCPFRYWKKLSPKAQKDFSAAVKRWMKRKHTFAQTLEI